MEKIQDIEKRSRHPSLIEIAVEGIRRNWIKFRLNQIDRLDRSFARDRYVVENADVQVKGGANSRTIKFTERIEGDERSAAGTRTSDTKITRDENGNITEISAERNVAPSTERLRTFHAVGDDSSREGQLRDVVRDLRHAHDVAMTALEEERRQGF